MFVIIGTFLTIEQNCICYVLIKISDYHAIAISEKLPNSDREIQNDKNLEEK